MKRALCHHCKLGFKPQRKRKSSSQGYKTCGFVRVETKDKKGFVGYKCEGYIPLSRAEIARIHREWAESEANEIISGMNACRELL